MSFQVGYIKVFITILYVAAAKIPLDCLDIFKRIFHRQQSELMLKPLRRRFLFGCQELSLGCPVFIKAVLIHPDDLLYGIGRAAR